MTASQRYAVKLERFRSRTPKHKFDRSCLELSNGAVALIDPEDYDRVFRYTWSLKRQGARQYAIGYDRSVKSKISLHRLIMRAGTGQIVDHINGNGLDNRKSNLRICSNVENSRNAGARSNKTSAFKGVAFVVASGTWRAQITHHGQKISLGNHKTEELAARAYDEAATKLFGDFARLNFPSGFRPVGNAKYGEAQAATVGLTTNE